MRLVGDPDDVVERLLRRLGAAERVAEDVGAEALGLLRAEALLEQLVPHPPRGAELRDLLEEVEVRGEEQEDRGANASMSRPRSSAALMYSMPFASAIATSWTAVEPGVADVVAAELDGLPARQVVRAVLDDVDGEPQRRARREDVGPAGEVLLQDVVLQQDAEAVRADSRATRRRR